MSDTTRWCDICKTPIEPERLESVPGTSLCVEHAQQIQKFGGEFKYKTFTEGTGAKTGKGIVGREKTRNLDAIERLREQYEAASDAGQAE